MSEYPYIVVRLMATAYQRVEIKDFKEMAGKAGVVGVKGRGRLHLLRKWAMKTGFRACLVISLNSCWYVEPDGSMKHSDEIPGGGIQMAVL